MAFGRVFRNLTGDKPELTDWAIPEDVSEAVPKEPGSLLAAIGPGRLCGVGGTTTASRLTGWGFSRFSGRPM